jgi:predicted MPP superfamily phosphohydrolase
VPEYLYVNIGVGEVGIPSRIGAVPEVTLITLRRGDNLTVPKAEK